MHDAILSRIAKLRAMTVANGCTEAEALVAFSKLSALMSEHNISEAQLSHHTTCSDMMTDSWTYTGPASWSGVNRAIEELFSVKFWRERETPELDGIPMLPYTRMFCFGFPADVAAALAMSNICYMAIIAETERRRMRPANIPAFQAGMGVRLGQRIRELRNQPPGTALTRKAMVWEEFYRQHPDFRGATRRSRYDARAYGAGFSAGAGVALGHAKAISSTRLIARS